jgi:copper chaperone CopZ
MSATIPVSDASATLSITGMTCGHCISNVRSALERVPGVGSVDVVRGTATIRVDAKDREAVVARAIEAVTSAGYPAVQVD